MRPSKLSFYTLHFTLPLLALLIGLSVAPARAQVSPVPAIEAAELIFDQGIDAFEKEFYDVAYRNFEQVYASYPLNRKTTAALLMGGKALYRAERYAEAADVLNRLITQYSTSGYLDEARRVRSFARRQQEGGGPKRITLGITLPMRPNDAVFVQALFNGIRLAVEEINETSAARVQMVFRDAGGSPPQAREAVHTLIREGTNLIIGPLRSTGAKAAAAAAEDEQIVLVTPLATDIAVSEGRRYVFQANPPIATRGREMAAFAVNSLLVDEVGIIAQANSPEDLSERMAEAFRDEVLRQGGEVLFYEQLSGERGWTHLADSIGVDTLSSVEAVYLPLAGSRAPRLIRGSLKSISQAAPRVRVLGNAQWHDRAIDRMASRLRVTYSNDFYVDSADAAVQTFTRRYREAYGRPPGALGHTARRLAYTGYDVTQFFLSQALNAPADQPLAQAFRKASSYQGLGIRIDLEGTNVNHALYYQGYRNGSIELLK